MSLLPNTGISAKTFHQRHIDGGKLQIFAAGAAARNLVVMLNAIIRDNQPRRSQADLPGIQLLRRRRRASGDLSNSVLVVFIFCHLAIARILALIYY